MGTSSPFGGPGNNTPLLPSWADPPPFDVEPTPQPTDLPLQPDPIRPPVVPPPQPDRFNVARNNFTRFVSSGGTDRSALARAVSGHVRTVSGGAGTAARRMGTSRRAAANLLGVLRDIQTNGVAETLRSLALSDLVGRSPREILIAFTDVICLPGGTIDEAIARDAYVETVLEVEETGVDLSALTEEQINVITVRFISRSIVNRVINDIGQKIDVRAFSAEQANYLVRSVFDFVLGAVQDRLQRALQGTRRIAKSLLNATVGRIYEVAFSLLDEEAGRLI